MADEEKEVVTVENKGGKGNPHHAPKGAPNGTGGQFVSADGVDSGEVLKQATFEDDDLGVVEIQAAPPRGAMGMKFLEFLNKKKEEKDKEANELVDKIKNGIDSSHQEFYNNLSREEKIALLYKSPVGYDKKKLKFATDSQLTALLYIEAIDHSRVQLEQEIEIWKKARKDIEDEMETTLSQNNIDGISGVWKDENGLWVTKYPSDYIFLSNSGSIDRKREYYNGVLSNPESPMSERFKATQKLKELDEFVKNGLAYEDLKKELMLKNLDAMEEIETKMGELLEKQKSQEVNPQLLEESKKYLNDFVDFEATYSQERKNKAIWFKNFTSSYNHFSGRASEHWGAMSDVEHAVIKAYTGSGYSRFNKPLRGINHAEYGYSFDEYGLNTFSEGVNNLTNAIDKCTWDEDIWVNRYINNHTKMFKLPGSNEVRSLESMSDSELQLLVGSSFTDGGFFSAGAAKGTGYKTGDIVFNVYCPKGTHMAYVAPYTTSGKGENEMILQRGYSYRITKVERKGGSYYLDMEVILGSDANKPVGNDLKKLGNEYYYKPRKEKGEDYD